MLLQEQPRYYKKYFQEVGIKFYELVMPVTEASLN